MKLTQDWTGYIDRSYEQIKRSLLKRLSLKAPEISDHSESNPLIIILSMFAGVAEVIHLYLDSIARESFLGTARKYSSVVKITRLIDYDIKAKGIASALERFTLVDNDGNITTHGVTITIPAGIEINPLNSQLPFILRDDVIIPAGQSFGYGVVEQYEQVTNGILGNTNGTALQKIPITEAYVHGSMTITIDSEPWVRYTSFGLMGPTTKGFVIEIDEAGDAYVVFGDDTNGKIPLNGKTVFGSYRVTGGTEGNVPPDSLTELVSVVVLPVGIELEITNPDYASGGTDFETIDEIKNRAPRSLRTLDRAVTYQDYIDTALQVVGVGAAELSYCCGKYIDLYIAPQTRGVATQALIDAVQEYIDDRKMITTHVDVKPAGATRIWLELKVIAKPLQDPAAVRELVLAELDEEFGPNNSRINASVQLTNFITILESLREVDTVEISKIRIEPYARPLEANPNVLNITFPVLPTGNQGYKYTIVYNSVANNFEIYKAGIFLDTVAVGVPFADAGAVSFQINAGVYANGNKWEFSTFPSYPEIFPQTIININDFSEAIVDVGPFIDEFTPRTFFGIINVEVQQVRNQLPPC